MAFTNKNPAASFQETTSTSAWVELNGSGVNRGAGGAGYPCTEVLISSVGGTGVYIADTFDNYTDNNFFIPTGQAVTIKGVTNCNDLSAKAAGSGGSVHYRAQHYGGYIIAAG